MRFLLPTALITLSLIYPAYAMNSGDDVDELIEGLNEGKGLNLKTPKKGKPPKKNKSPQSEPKKSKAYKFDVTLHRYQQKKKACTYFSKDAVLTCSGVSLSNSEDPIFGEGSSLSHMDDFLWAQVQKYKTPGWSCNHLAADLFVVVNDKTQEEQRCITGSLLVEAQGDGPYEFSISPSNLHLNGRKKANFMSSQETDEGIKTLMEQKGYLPIYQGKEGFQQIFDDNNHGDRLALDTISSNVDLFFSLIKKRHIGKTCPS